MKETLCSYKTTALDNGSAMTMGGKRILHCSTVEDMADKVTEAVKSLVCKRAIKKSYTYGHCKNFDSMDYTHAHGSDELKTSESTK